MRMVKKVCCCLVTACLAGAALFWIANIVQRKDSDFKYNPFFAQEADFDVLFFGTSHVINGIFPMELWKDYGIVSYNFGGHANLLPTSYWVMENALDYTSPKLAVIDGLGLGLATKSPDTFSYTHLSLDAFPFSLKKAAAARDILDDAAMEEKIKQGTVQDAAERTWMGLLWDFSVYHPRWNGLSQNDFEPSSTKEKGAESRIAVCEPMDVVKVKEDVKMEGETAGTEYLYKMIESCKERGIEVLLVYLPFPAIESSQLEANRLSDIAQEYGVGYINFLDMDVVDYRTDCYDASSHLNPSGARKVTDYIGKYIQSHYQIPDNRENEAYRGWHGDYADYREFKVSNLRQQQALDVYLMLLADKNYHALIQVKDAAFWKGSGYIALLENLGIDMDKILGKTDCILVQGAGEAVTYLEDFCVAGKEHDTPAGTFCTSRNGNGDFTVSLDGKEFYNVQEGQDAETDVRIAVFEEGTQNLVDFVGFALQGSGNRDVQGGKLAVTGVYRRD